MMVDLREVGGGVMREQRLLGGRTAGAVRVGETIHKPTQRWTPGVRAVLDHLEGVGFEGAPRALGSTTRAARS
jgi:hypothetical protein